MLYYIIKLSLLYKQYQENQIILSKYNKITPNNKRYSNIKYSIAYKSMQEYIPLSDHKY